MKYTTTTRTKHEAKLSPECSLAIMAYIKVKKAEDKLEKLEAELTSYVVSMTGEDLAHYVAITDEYENKE